MLLLWLLLGSTLGAAMEDLANRPREGQVGEKSNRKVTTDELDDPPNEMMEDESKYGDAVKGYNVPDGYLTAPSYADPMLLSAVMSQAEEANFRFPLPKTASLDAESADQETSASVASPSRVELNELNPFKLLPPEFHKLLEIPMHTYRNGSTFNPNDRFEKPPKRHHVDVIHSDVLEPTKSKASPESTTISGGEKQKLDNLMSKTTRKPEIFDKIVTNNTSGTTTNVTKPTHTPQKVETSTKISRTTYTTEGYTTKTPRKPPIANPSLQPDSLPLRYNKRPPYFDPKPAKESNDTFKKIKDSGKMPVEKENVDLHVKKDFGSRIPQLKEKPITGGDRETSTPHSKPREKTTLLPSKVDEMETYAIPDRYIITTKPPHLRPFSMPNTQSSHHRERFQNQEPEVLPPVYNTYQRTTLKPKEHITYNPPKISSTTKFKASKPVYPSSTSQVNDELELKRPSKPMLPKWGGSEHSMFEHSSFERPQPPSLPQQRPDSGNWPKPFLKFEDDYDAQANQWPTQTKSHHAKLSPKSDPNSHGNKNGHNIAQWQHANLHPNPKVQDSRSVLPQFRPNAPPQEENFGNDQEMPKVPIKEVQKPASNRSKQPRPERRITTTSRPFSFMDNFSFFSRPYMNRRRGEMATNSNEKQNGVRRQPEKTREEGRPNKKHQYKYSPSLVNENANKVVVVGPFMSPPPGAPLLTTTRASGMIPPHANIRPPPPAELLQSEPIIRPGYFLPKHTEESIIVGKLPHVLSWSPSIDMTENIGSFSGNAPSVGVSKRFGENNEQKNEMRKVGIVIPPREETTDGSYLELNKSKFDDTESDAKSTVIVYGQPVNPSAYQFPSERGEAIITASYSVNNYTSGEQNQPTMSLNPTEREVVKKEKGQHAANKFSVPAGYYNQVDRSGIVAMDEPGERIHTQRHVYQFMPEVREQIHSNYGSPIHYEFTSRGQQQPFRRASLTNPPFGSSQFSSILPQEQAGTNRRVITNADDYQSIPSDEHKSDDKTKRPFRYAQRTQDATTSFGNIDQERQHEQQSDQALFTNEETKQNTGAPSVSILQPVQRYPAQPLNLPPAAAEVNINLIPQNAPEVFTAQPFSTWSTTEAVTPMHITEYNPHTWRPPSYLLFETPASYHEPVAPSPSFEGWQAVGAPSSPSVGSGEQKSPIFTYVKENTPEIILRKPEGEDYTDRVDKEVPKDTEENNEAVVVSDKLFSRRMGFADEDHLVRFSSHLKVETPGVRAHWMQPPAILY